MGDDIWQLSACEIRDGLAQGTFSSVDVVQAHLARIDQVNPKLNALVHRFDEEALKGAQASDQRREKGESVGPLDGIPMTIKESLATVGTPVTLGIENRRNEPTPRDSVVVELLRKQGAIILGKTNIPQLLLCHETDNKIWGRTPNPFDHERVPGGSSGGEAAAIASGMAPWGVGTDIGGSIRVPAAFCGISGLKPTVDRWSNLRSYTALMGQETVRGQCGPMARRAKDVAFLFRALDSPMHATLDPGVAPVSTPDPASVSLAGLKVGYYSDDGFLAASPSVARGVEEAAKLLEAAGATVIPFTPPSQNELITLYYSALSSDGGATVRERLKGDALIPQLKMLMRSANMPNTVRKGAAWLLGKKGEHRIERVLKAVGAKSVNTYWKLNAQRSAMRLEALAAWDKSQLDIVLCPTHATVALRHGDSADFSAAGSYSMRYNLLNFPAGAVPVTTVSDEDQPRATPRDRIEKVAASVEKGSKGLPVGIQVVGRPFEEHKVLAAMIAIDEGAQGHTHFPQTPV
jgi:fatty acid amide hydrolase